MQPQPSTTSSPYYHQYYQTATDLPPFNPASAAPYASAPPVTASPPDYSYPSFPPNSGHVPNPPQYSFPHLQDTSQNHHLYRHNQAPVDYDYDQRNSNPNPEPAYDPSYSLNSYSYGSSDVPYHGNSYESNLNYGGDQRIYDDGVYKYNGGPVEPSSGGKGGRSSDSGGGSGVIFDDYGRPIIHGGKEQNEFGNYSPKIVKAVPKVEDSEDVKSGVQKFRVKLLSEGYGQPDMDVLCQVDKYHFLLILFACYLLFDL